jgi:uncharacterized membrane protein YjgN (DUF898 family)
MRFSTHEDRWSYVGLDDDGARVFFDPGSVRAEGLRVGRIEVTVIVMPAAGSESFRAIQELLSRAGKSQADPSYVEQSWSLNLSRKLYAIRSFIIRDGDDTALHSVPLSGIDLNPIEEGSVAAQVSQLAETLVQDQVVPVPESDVPPQAEAPRLRVSVDPDEKVPAYDIPEKRPVAMPVLPRRLFFKGTGFDLFTIFIVNVFLTIITFGFYSFWGRVRVRKYFMRETQFVDDGFEFHGTGGELLRGWVKAMIVFGLPFVLLPYIPHLLGGHVAVRQIVSILSYFIVFLFVPVAMVGARRYRLSRTSWREIRFSFRGKTWEFVKLYLVGTLLTVITLGLYKPFFDTRTYDYMVSRSYFGNRIFQFDGTGRDLFRPFLLAWLLTIPTLGIYWFSYWARKQRYLWEHTSCGTLRFQSTVTGGALAGLHAVNLLLLLVTLGLAWPWVKVRKARFLFDYLRLKGPFDPDAIVQEAQAASPTGEALAGFFDMDFDLG